MKISTVKFVASFTLASALFLSTEALATDAKGLPGSACSQVVSGSSVSQLSWSRRLNTSTTKAWFDCPLVDDVMGQRYDLSRSAIWVLDLSSTDFVDCHMGNRVQTSAAIGGWSFAGSYPAAAGDPNTYTSTSPTKITFAGTPGVTDPWTTATMNFFSCGIPAKSGQSLSGIVSYFTEEL